jgi:hypothetical protein
VDLSAVESRPPPSLALPCLQVGAAVHHQPVHSGQQQARFPAAQRPHLPVVRRAQPARSQQRVGAAVQSGAGRRWRRLNPGPGAAPGRGRRGGPGSCAGLHGVPAPAGGRQPGEPKRTPPPPPPVPPQVYAELSPLSSNKVAVQFKVGGANNESRATAAARCQAAAAPACHQAPARVATAAARRSHSPVHVVAAPCTMLNSIPH